MTNNEITTEEKIDYIYDRLKKQQKVEVVNSILKWGTRIFIVISLVYFFFVKLPVLKDEIIDSITPEIPKFDVESISSSDMLNGLKEKFTNMGGGELSEENLEDISDTLNNFY